MAKRLIGLLTCLSFMWVMGCVMPSAGRAGLDAVYPPDRAQAVVQVAETRNLEAIHGLVALLDDPDSGVRMYAILALKRLCDEDYGYRYYASEADRAGAIERWREALRDGSVHVVAKRGPENGPGVEVIGAVRR
ncbi:MAG: HEAT repeat domain-containing protein [Phycisphaerales bacterium]|nr:HEAT repeat domain-containing protein [Phycisphaerales bacterium]